MYEEEVSRPFVAHLHRFISGKVLIISQTIVKRQMIFLFLFLQYVQNTKCIDFSGKGKSSLGKAEQIFARNFGHQKKTEET